MMEYPKRVMKASELAVFTGQKKEYFSRLVHLPGQRFAWKASQARNSPVMIDTEEYEKWRQRQVKLGRR